MNNLVTWLLPVKNGMPYLSKTLASIENQTYKNWEILVWDNGSTDNTLEELKKWIPSRLPGKIISDRPMSVGGARRAMIEQCKTELCALIDADDVNLPNRLEKQVAFLLANPNIAVLGSQMYIIDSKGKRSKKLYTVPQFHDDIINGMLTRNSIAQPAVLLRKSAILQSGNYRDLYFQWNQVNIEDYDLWLRVSQNYKFANLDIPLVEYRIHENSTTQLALRENRFYEAIVKCLCENAPKTFGCSEVDMRLLYERKHPFAMRPILQIAKYLQQTQGGKLKDRLSSPSFLNSVTSLIASKDIISRLYIASHHKDKSILYQELKSIVKKVIKKIPGFC